MVEQWKTDDLMAEMGEERDKLNAVMDDYDAAYPAYDLVKGDLDLMNNKVNFLGNLMRRTMDIIVPDTSEAEEDGLGIIFADFSNLGIAKNVLWLATAPLTGSLVLQGVVHMGWAAKGGRVARLAKASKLSKIVRFGKIAGPAALALEVGMFIWTEAQSHQVNDDLRESIKEIKASIGKAKEQLAKLKDVTSKAVAQRDGMLKEAGVSTPDEYVQKLTLAIADVGALRFKLNTARTMLLMGQLDQATMLQIIGPENAELLERVRKRLEAEIAFSEGAETADVVAQTGLSEEIVAEVRATIDARDAYVRGMLQADIMETTGIAEGTYEEIEDSIDTALGQAWPEVEGSAPMTALAKKLVMRPAAFDDLRLELAAKTKLNTHIDESEVASAHGIDRALVVQWASDLPLQKEEARLLKAQASLSPAEIAAECRLTLKIVEAIA